MRAISSYLVGRERTVVHRLYAPPTYQIRYRRYSPVTRGDGGGSGGVGLIRLIGLMGPIRLIAVIVKVGEGYTGGTRGMG